MNRPSSHSSSSSSIDNLALTAAVVMAIGAATAAAAATTTALAAVLWLRRVSDSVGVAPPTLAMMQQEEPIVKCPLIRHVPQLAHCLAWRSLGAVQQPTPIHKCTLPALSSSLQHDSSTDNNNNATSTTTDDNKNQTPTLLSFWVKREDLIHPQYGGNKVRTLQHQLAVCEAKRDTNHAGGSASAYRHLVSLGTGGSNQVVACVVHGRRLGWNIKKNDDDGRPNKDRDAAPSITPCWYDKDEPDLDNTLNMLSVLSMQQQQQQSVILNWGQSHNPLAIVRALWGAYTQTNFIPLMLGGNCPTGVLGQVSGVLELAEQIRAGQAPQQLQRIYVATGSACTVSGLIVGVVLVQEYLQWHGVLDQVQIVACVVHEKLAWLDRCINLHLNPWCVFLPLTITHSVVAACRTLTALGGPNLEQACRKFMRTRVQLRCNADVVGLYGGHSEPSRQAARHYDAHGVVTDEYNNNNGNNNKEVPGLWVCGHFVAKALQPLLVDLEQATAAAKEQQQKEPPQYMLWMTKSAIQPLGNDANEWKLLQAENKDVLQWANAGQAESTLRPGKVCTQTGSPDDYRHLMTKIAIDKQDETKKAQ